MSACPPWKQHHYLLHTRNTSTTIWCWINLYSPNDKALSLNALPAVEDHYVVVGDFNSHSQSWGYDHIDKREVEVENWQDDHKLYLINKPEDQPTFYSRRWRTTSTPDIAFCTDDLDGQINRKSENNLEVVIIVQCS